MLFVKSVNPISDCVEHRLNPQINKYCGWYRPEYAEHYGKRCAVAAIATGMQPNCNSHNYKHHKVYHGDDVFKTQILYHNPRFFRFLGKCELGENARGQPIGWLSAKYSLDLEWQIIVVLI